jgi:hypothetical protein
MEETSTASLLAKYFAHGFLHSVLLLILELVWAVLFIGLVIFGFLIGFIIGLLVLFLIIGGLNTVLMELVWNIQLESDWKSLLKHGFILFVALLLVNVPSIIIGLARPELVVQVAVFLVYCFIDGYVARSIGGSYEESAEYVE